MQEDGFYREDKVMKDVRAKTKPVNEMLVSSIVAINILCMYELAYIGA